jgi:hypothetical protein
MSAGFDCTAEGRAIRWTKWVDRSRLQTYFQVGRISTNDDQQKAILLQFGAADLYDIVDTFPADALAPLS